MAVRQYIGARYVPIFMGTYDSTTVYEPLSIVSYNNGSYTSKKAVPAGIEPTNTEYWVLSGNYNAQVEEYRQEVIKMGVRVDGVEQDMVSLKTEVEQEIDDLRTEANRFVLVVGDSYADPANTVNHWGIQLKKFLGLDDNHYYTAYGGGYGFTPGGKFIDLITPGASPHGVPTGFEVGKVTDIVVGGGFNDGGASVSDIETAIAEFMAYAKETYINARVYVAAFSWSWNNEYLRDLNAGRFAVAYQTCAKYGGIYVSGIECVMHKLDLFLPQPDPLVAGGTQWVHPNELGSKEIGKQIANFMRGGSCNVDYEFIVENIKLDSAYRQSGNFSIATKLNGNVIYVTNDQKLLSQTNITLTTGETKILIGETLNDNGNFKSHEGVKFPVSCFIAGGSYQKNTPVPAFLGFQEGKFYLWLVNGEGGTCTDIFLYPSPSFVPAFMY